MRLTTLRSIPFQPDAPVRLLRIVFRGAPIFPTVTLAVFVVMGVFGRWLTPHDPNQMKLAVSLVPPFWGEGGSTTYLLGTDHLGRAYSAGSSVERKSHWK